MIETLGYVKEREAAKLLDKSPGTIRNWRSAGFGPSYAKNGAHVLYPIAGLRAWLVERTVKPASQPTFADPRRRVAG